MCSIQKKPLTTASVSCSQPVQATYFARNQFSIAKKAPNPCSVLYPQHHDKLINVTFELPDTRANLYDAAKNTGPDGGRYREVPLY